MHRAQAAALKTARPGVECQAVDAAARKVITDAGYGPDYKFFTHRVGHGIGMDGHEWPYLVRGNTTLLARNMTFSDEPGIYIRGEFGVRLEDDMHITENGAELFTPQSPSLEDPFGVFRWRLPLTTAFRLRHRRAPVETEQIGIPHIAQILDSNLAGEKAVSSHLAKKGKELHTRAAGRDPFRHSCDRQSDREFPSAVPAAQSRKGLPYRSAHSPSSHIMPPPSFN